jgi:hypothetical protein
MRSSSCNVFREMSAATVSVNSKFYKSDEAKSKQQQWSSLAINPSLSVAWLVKLLCVTAPGTAASETVAAEEVVQE